MAQIPYITKDDIVNKDILFEYIYNNQEINYYFSDKFDCEFYILLARAGFISVSYSEDDIQYLLPEMQFEYAVLDFENLHISKKVKKLLKQKNLYSFSIDQDFDNVLKLIDKYHKDNWIVGDYLNLLKKLYKYNSDISFKLISCELKAQSTDEIIAGEVGYIIGSTYTSLSGFSLKEKQYNNWGKLQMVLLAKYLQKNDFSFWNLGHPYMKYKLDLGAKVLNRIDFLQRWLKMI